MDMNEKIMGGGILAVDKQTGRILFGRRGLEGDHPNTWSPFGGTYDKGKDNIPRNTAIREFREETGCNVSYLLSKKPFYINDDNHVKFYTYMGLFKKQFPVKINNENLDFEWFDVNHLPDNLLPGVKEMLAEKLNNLKRFIEKHCIS